MVPVFLTQRKYSLQQLKNNKCNLYESTQLLRPVHKFVIANDCVNICVNDWIDYVRLNPNWQASHNFSHQFFGLLFFGARSLTETRLKHGKTLEVKNKFFLTQTNRQYNTPKTDQRQQLFLSL